jgi:hypothetical protein
VSRPSEMILADHDMVERVDAIGRRLKVRKPNVVDRLRLFKAVGPDAAQNEPYLGLALTACAVKFIDDIPVPHPSNEQQIENLILRLGDAGMNAAGTVVAVREPSNAEVRQEAGNSAGTPI